MISKGKLVQVGLEPMARKIFLTTDYNHIMGDELSTFVRGKFKPFSSSSTLVVTNLSCLAVRFKREINITRKLRKG